MDGRQSAREGEEEEEERDPIKCAVFLQQPSPSAVHCLLFVPVCRPIPGPLTDFCKWAGDYAIGPAN